MKTWIALILLSLGLPACQTTPSDGDRPDAVSLRLDNNGGFGNGGRQIDFLSDRRLREYRYSDAVEDSVVSHGTYQKGGGSITLLSDRPGASVETLFQVEHGGEIYWVGSELLAKIRKPEESALRQAALREKPQ